MTCAGAATGTDRGPGGNEYPSSGSGPIQLSDDKAGPPQWPGTHPRPRAWPCRQAPGDCRTPH
eukprot:977824-Alexandrium_andersonii.AAC.1